MVFVIFAIFYLIINCKNERKIKYKFCNNSKLILIFRLFCMIMKYINEVFLC